MGTFSKGCIASLLVCTAVAASSCGEAGSRRTRSRLQAQAGPDKVLVGDMVFDARELQQGRALVRGQAGAVEYAASGFVYYRGRPWTNGVMPVAFEGYGPEDQERFFEACREWETRANVRCVRRSNERQYLNFRNVSPCNTEVGMGDGVRTMNMGGCMLRGQLVHEIGHAFGLLHEHQRSDRDRYIAVNYDRVVSEYRFAYEVISSSNNVTSYDFMSIMHYPPNSYSRNGEYIMTPRAGYEEFADTMGATVFREMVPTESDGQAMASIYGSVSRPRHTITLRVDGPGGSVLAGYGSFSSSVSTASVEQGTRIPIAAAVIAGQSSRFVEWRGDCSGLAPSAEVVVNGDYACTAVFEAPDDGGSTGGGSTGGTTGDGSSGGGATGGGGDGGTTGGAPTAYTLRIAITGSGGGQVSTARLSCPSGICAVAVPAGESVTLAASPYSGHRFVRFVSGAEACPISSSGESFAINADVACLAEFEAVTPPTTCDDEGSFFPGEPGYSSEAICEAAYGHAVECVLNPANQVCYMPSSGGGTGGGSSGGSGGSTGSGGATATIFGQNEALEANESIESPNREYALVFQGDGNLVLYQGSRDLWSSGTHGLGGTSAVLQGDGNLVIYGPDGAIWSSGTQGNDGAHLELRNSGELVIVSSDGRVVWSATGGVAPAGF